LDYNYVRKSIVKEEDKKEHVKIQNSLQHKKLKQLKQSGFQPLTTFSREMNCAYSTTHDGFLAHNQDYCKALTRTRPAKMPIPVYYCTSCLFCTHCNV